MAATANEGRITGLDHVQLTMPAGHEAEATCRAFYLEALGLREIEKPEVLKPRGGIWFQGAGFQLHLSIEDVMVTRRHPGLVTDDLEAIRARVEAAGYATVSDPGIPGVRRFYVTDPFQNRIEIQEYEPGFSR